MESQGLRGDKILEEQKRRKRRTEYVHRGEKDDGIG